MSCEQCDGGCKSCSCRWETARDDLLLFLAENFDDDDVDAKKISTRTARFAACRHCIMLVFGHGALGKGNRAQAPSCVVNTASAKITCQRMEKPRDFWPSAKAKNSGGGSFVKFKKEHRKQAKQVVKKI